MTPTDLRSRQTIEALRSGVPSRAAVSELGTTQSAIESEFLDAIQQVQEGYGVSPIVFSASFGDGKSHLLRHLQGQAEKAGFVTSFVVVTPETPLGNAHVVLKSIAEQAEAPGRTGKAVMELASNPPKGAASELLAWAKDAYIEDRFRALLRVYESTPLHDDLHFQILNDLEGRPLIKTRLAQELRKLGEASHYTLKGPRNPLLAHDRVQILAHFFRCHNAKGLVVFFDEVERIVTFQFNARLKAYQELGWWNRICQERNSNLIAVFSQTQGSIDQCLKDKGDEERIRSGYSLLPDESVQLAIEGIQLIRSSKPIQPPTNDQLESLQHIVRELYSRAFDVIPNPVKLKRTSSSIRSEIRRWITIWDIERHYPTYIPQVESKGVTMDTRELSDEESASSDNDSE